MGKGASIEVRAPLAQCVQERVAEGIGEIVLKLVDLAGMVEGYDRPLSRRVAQEVNVPVVACGGAGTLEHLVAAVHEGGASAAAAGSMFVFHGKHRAVLITYPNPAELEKKFAQT